uniref:Pyrrolo-quinoline quinone repeat domain-containing protein n=1 Tax=Cryptomonas curvata TaxID=233186 RepID=A0A7S0N644_9CRYP|mmetsp:Transcript_7912/g.16858  ORF Transcript_7912/g.16858 Transcript_7912/m.16858 type:complete len:1369 (+) Transcript_7912:167-4273(+)
MCRPTNHWIAVLASCALIIPHANAAGETVCNIPVSGTLLAGDSTAPYSQIRLGINSNTQDNYYVGSKITMMSGAASGQSSTISAYCGQGHSSCPGIGGSGLIQSVTMPPQISPNNELVKSQKLQLILPSVDANNFVTPTTGSLSGCFDPVTRLPTFSSPSCNGPYRGLTLQIVKGTGAGQSGVIQAGPDSNREVVVSGLSGTCYGGCSSRGRTVSNYELSERWVNTGSTPPVCPALISSTANNGARCTTNADCTWGGVCKPPVDALVSVYVLVGGPGGGGCNPLCNGLASFTATVDFSAATSAGDAYTLMRGCYDEQHAAGMRRLGGAGAGAGQRPVTLAWKSLIPDGEIIGRPGLAADGSVIVASARGTLNKISADGGLVWSIYVGSVVSSPAIGEDGTIYFGSGDRNVWAVTDGGMTRWRYTTPMPVVASAHCTSEAVYIGDRNGTMYKFNLDGSVAWRFATKGEIWGTPRTTRDGRVVFGSMDKTFYCVSDTDGTLIWAYDAQQEIAGTPLIQDVSIVFGTRENEDAYGKIVKLDMGGNPRWLFPVTSSIDSEPVEGNNGEVYVATVDGRVFAVQADGQLLWKYLTGGTGGVCPLQGNGAGYSTDYKTLISVVGNVARLDSSAASLPTGYYNGYRAIFTVGMGTLVQGQFNAVQKAIVQYAPDVAAHDGVFLDSSSQSTSIVLSFKTKDIMIPSESISFPLYGLTSSNAPSVAIFPQDKVNVCNNGAGSTCKAAGTAAFHGVQGTAQTGTSYTITLSLVGNCGADQACVGSTIKFTSGSGSGQTAIIVDYVQATLVATITYVETAADLTTTYAISSAPVSKFTAGWTTGTPGSLKLSILSSTGTTLLCTPSLCSATTILLAPTEKSAAGYYDGHTIEFVGGLGKGQTATCLRYYGALNSYKCDITPVTVAADSTTTYRIGPSVAPGEEVVLVIPRSQGFIYPHNSGLAVGGTTSTLTLAASASTIPNFYQNMNLEVRLAPGALSLASAVTDLGSTTVVLSALPAVSRIDVGSYIKVDNEVMLVQALNVNTATVLRAQLGTSASTHLVGAIPAVYAYSTITAYNSASKVVTFVPALSLALAANDQYRISGTSAFFSIIAGANTVFQSSLSPYEYDVQISEYQTTTVKLMQEPALSDGFYVGATLHITKGPGLGLSGQITAYTVATGLAAITFDLAACAGPAACAPKGSSDNGYLLVGSPTSAYPLSHYEIVVTGNVASYSGLTSDLVLTQPLVFSIPAVYAQCNSYDDTILKRVCLSLNPNTPTPVKLEWVSGSWCPESGGTGWGATSPCVANGLIVTTSSNKYVYGLGTDGVVKFKFMTGKRIKAPPRCVANPDQSVTIFVGSNDHHVYRLEATAQKTLRGTMWY